MSLEPMPDLSAIAAADHALDPPGVTRLIHGGQIYQPYDGAAVTNLLDRASASPATTGFVQKAKTSEGTGVVGLYLEAVVFNSAGNPFAHMKFFIIDRNIYVYNRSAADARANWRLRREESLAAALGVVQQALGKNNVRMFGHPVLVELTADDLSAVESGAMPPGRFRGQYRVERDYGRYDFAMEVRSANLPTPLVKLLSDARWRRPHTADAEAAS